MTEYTTPQLSYAIADGVGAGRQGGWGVVEETPGLWQETKDVMVRGRTVSMPQYVDQFMSDAQLQQRPVRWRVRPFDEGCIAWRSVEAGTDSTGRPGNVFTHAALLELLGPMRPMDWASSADWLSPFGADQVAGARLPREITPSFMQLPFLNWLHDAARDEQQTNAAVAQAIRAIEEGLQVVVVLPSSSDGISFLDYLTWMLPAVVARRLSCAVWEDSRSAPEVIAADYDIVCVNRAGHALAEGPRGRVISIDPSSMNPLAADDPWQTVLTNCSRQIPGELRETLLRRDKLADSHALDAYQSLAAAAGLVPVPQPTMPMTVDPAVSHSGVARQRSEVTPVHHRNRNVGGVDLETHWPGHDDSAARYDGLFRGDPDNHGVGLRKDPPSVSTSAPSDSGRDDQDDPLAGFAFPVPTSTLAAMEVLQSHGVVYNTYRGRFQEDAWPERVHHLAPLGRLALMHIATQDPVVTWRTRSVQVFIDGIGADSYFTRLMWPSLMALAIAEIDDGGSPDWTAAGGWSVLKEFVGRLSQPELLPLAFRFSRLADLLDQQHDHEVPSHASTNDAVGRAHDWLVRNMHDRPDRSVWGLRTGSGQKLIEVVLNELSGRGREEILWQSRN